jgi:branched-chain amino acid transport system substrate-binding protein
MLGRRLGFVGVISIAALCARPGLAEIRIGVAGPMTGAQSWFGEQFERGAGMAAADLNANGGILGQQVEVVATDDFCDPDRAVAAANKLVGDGVVFVVGHWCSHSSIAASTVYQRARVLMITPGSASAKLTDEGGPNVFRVYGRDDRQGDGRRLPRRALGGQGDRDPG